MRRTANNAQHMADICKQHETALKPVKTCRCSSLKLRSLQKVVCCSMTIVDTFHLLSFIGCRNRPGESNILGPGWVYVVHINQQ